MQGCKTKQVDRVLKVAEGSKFVRFFFLLPSCKGLILLLFERNVTSIHSSESHSQIISKKSDKQMDCEAK